MERAHAAPDRRPGPRSQYVSVRCFRTMIATLLVLLAVGPALADSPIPATVSVVTKADGDKLSARWPDMKGATQALVATFPAGTIASGEVYHFEKAPIMTLLGQRLQAWSNENGLGVTVTVSGTELTMKTTRTENTVIDREIASAQAQRETMYAALLAELHLGRVGPGQLQYDHARIAAESVAAIRPLADALGPAAGLREYAQRALTFVQGIPAEPLRRDLFATPLAVLREQRGDSDEKATLYAALIRAAAPDVPLAVLTMRDYAIVGLAVPAVAGDRTVTVEGTTWVVVDPAGPFLHPFGRVGPRADFVQLTLRRVP